MATQFQPPPQRMALTVSGDLVSQQWFGWFLQLAQLLSEGYTGTITTAKLTTGGTEGSMTFQNGVLIAQTAAS